MHALSSPLRVGEGSHLLRPSELTGSSFLHVVDIIPSKVDNSFVDVVCFAVIFSACRAYLTHEGAVFVAAPQPINHERSTLVEIPARDMRSAKVKADDALLCKLSGDQAPGNQACKTE